MSKKETNTGKEPLSGTDKWKKIEQEEEIEESGGLEDLFPEEDQEELPFPSRSKLEDELTAMEKKAEEYKEKAVRVQAEMENLRRRTEREVGNAHKYGAEKLIADLLPVADSMLRGLESPDSDDPRVKSMREGIALTIDLLSKALAKHGVKPIDPQPGEPFNPDLHEAMSAVQDPGAASNTIVQVMQQGYELNGRVLRAAMVVVAK